MSIYQASNPIPLYDTSIVSVSNKVFVVGGLSIADAKGKIHFFNTKIIKKLI